MLHAAALALGLMLAPAAPPVLQDGGMSREQSALTEEQELLARNLARLITSMERLAERYESEGRSHTASLLRGALEAAVGRDADEATTLEELMSGARGELSSGRAVEAIRSQEAAIGRLERLLLILMDRPDLEQIEKSLEDLKALRQELSTLADEESRLREDTERLREDARDAAQRALEQGIREALEQQRELTAKNEREARESGALELEELQRELARLRQDQATDLGVMRAWQPQERAGLEELEAPLEAARQHEARAERLARTAETLRRTAERARSAAREGEPTAPLVEQLEAERERQELHARASGEESAKRAAEALRRAAEALREAGADPSKADEAEQAIAAQAQQLGRDEEREREAARGARAQAREGLARLETDEPGTASTAAKEVTEELERADEGQNPAESTERALSALRKGLEELEFLGQALGASQARNAERSEQLAGGTERLPQGGEPQAESAREALRRAAEAMRESSDAAAREDAQGAQESAARAEQALERAQRELGQLGQQGAQGSSPLAQEQQELAQQTEQLGQRSEEASLSPEAREEVEGALEEAAQAMREASQQLSQGQRGEAASAQRRAQEALARAGQQTSEGVRPDDPEERERAEELARRQEEVRKKLYELAQRLEQDPESPELPSLSGAQQSAQQAEQSLQQGDLGQAGEQEERAEQQIREAMDDIQKEEEQYQRLREEELLFHIAEEVTAMLETHRGLIEQVNEVDAGREPGDGASRAQKLRLRAIARDSQALAQRSGEIQEAIEAEDSFVFAELVVRVKEDLERIARLASERGGYQSGERVQLLQRDVERQLLWLLEALEQEKQRRQEEDQQQQEQQQQPGSEGDQGENQLVPDAAELKLLRRMEREVLDAIEELLILNPELEQGGEVDEFLLEDVLRLAHRHERTTELFRKFREHLGLPDPGDEESVE